MKKLNKNNLIIYTLLAILFISNILLFSLLIFTTQNDAKNYEQSTFDDMKLLQRINRMEDKLNIEYDAETGKYK